MQEPLPSGLLEPVQSFVQQPDMLLAAIIQNIRLFHVNLFIERTIDEWLLKQYLVSKVISILRLKAPYSEVCYIDRART
jgi:hypothetical protein